MADPASSYPLSFISFWEHSYHLTYTAIIEMFCLSLMPQTKKKLTADIKDKKRESMHTITKTNKQKSHTNHRGRQEERMSQRNCKTIKTNKQERAAVSVCLSIIGEKLDR